MYNCVVINPNDTAGTLTTDVLAGDTVNYNINGNDYCLIAEDNIKIFHKIALKDIKKGDIIIKYGCKIGYATKDIKKGEHIHTQNLDSKMTN